MIEGLLIWVLALAIIFATPAARQIDARRQLRPPIAQQLEQAFRALPPPAPPLDELLVKAEAALERDQLTRGLRGIRDTYDRA